MENYYEYYKYFLDVPIYKLYHENTQLNSLNKSTFCYFISRALEDSQFMEESKDDNYKRKFGKETIKLKEPNIEGFNNGKLFEILNQRRSVRNFKSSTISEQIFSNFLYYSVGISGEYVADNYHSVSKLFRYPLAGAINSMYIYIIVNSVENISNGVYLYYPNNHSMILIKRNFECVDYENITSSEELAKNSLFSIHIAGDMRLKGWKYQDRGYRFLNIEAGHIAQNIYLVATDMGYGAVSSGGFLDGDFYDYIGIRKDEQYLLYEVFVGVPIQNVNE
ncbi:SagB/ThcOx family dehydrogenase [Anaerosalibacter sp. Marseille-P3206]|uniref:SagB/ThcOx family dehydrogenase n=1 Tax=Anaerosalibacter sp. Marseille-P3206 TaxID=1871005 RepID=UPI000985BBE9|nr:SagB/ThcOx family dehydrogenase [Anaerosalibacter sp. Marseille-P3206]